MDFVSSKTWPNNDPVEAPVEVVEEVEMMDEEKVTLEEDLPQRRR